MIGGVASRPCQGVAMSVPTTIITRWMQIAYGPHAGDSHQRVLMLRNFIAAGSSVLVLALYVVGWLLGVLPAAACLLGAALILSCIVAVHLVFRLGWNKRCADPSLTLPQIMISVFVNSYVLYHAGDARSIYLLIYLVSFLFGVFQLTTRSLFALAAMMVSCYGGVVLARVAMHPASVDVQAELARLIVLGAVLCWFALMGGYIQGLRSHLRAARDAAQAANRAKSQFLANMSHEIRTPLNGVLGMAELLQDSRLDEQQQHYVRTILTAGGGLLDIINDILDITKIEAGRLSLDPIDTDLAALIGDTMAMLRPRALQKGLAFESAIGTEVPARVRVDPVRLRQILLNLLGNALKFTERGEVALSVCVACGRHGVPMHRAVLRFEIRDTGIGIDGQAQARLFQAFSQADASTTRRYGGTGLGLHVSKQLVEMMHGSIGVDSEPGQGSIFWFTIEVEALAAAPDIALAAPVRATELPAGAKITESVRNGGPLRVLLAEDNLVNREIAVAMLQLLGCDVEVAANGEEAVGACLRSAYDLVLMDCMMPVMDGLEASRSIRTHETITGRRTPIVALTASAMTGDRERCLAAGMDDYLSKPFQRTDLQRTLDKWARDAHTCEAGSMADAA